MTTVFQLSPAQRNSYDRIKTLLAEIIILKRRLSGVGMVPRRPLGLREQVIGQIQNELKVKIEEHDKLVVEFNDTLPKAALSEPVSNENGGAS